VEEFGSFTTKATRSHIRTYDPPADPHHLVVRPSVSRWSYTIWVAVTF